MSAWPRSLYAGLHLLDRQVVDAEGRLAGKVDDLDLEVVPADTACGSELVVTAICFGHGALWRRLGWRHLGRWLGEHHDRPGARHDTLPLERVLGLGADVEVLARHEDLSTYDSEQWVRDHLTRHIPGSGHATVDDEEGDRAAE